MPQSIPERRQKMRDQIRSQYLEAFFKQQRKKRDELSLQSSHRIQQFFRHSLATLHLDFTQIQIKKSIGPILEVLEGSFQERNRPFALKQWIILVQITLKYLEQQQSRQMKIVVMSRIKTMVCSSFCRLLEDNKSLKWKIFNTYLDLMLSSQDILEYLPIQYITTISIIYKDLLIKGFSQNTNELIKLLYILNTVLKAPSNVCYFIVDLCISQKWILLKLIDFAVSEHPSQTIVLVQMILALFLNLLQFTPCNRISDLFFHSRFVQFLQSFLSFTEEVSPTISLLYLRLIHRIMTDSTQFLNLIRTLIDSSTLHLRFTLEQEIQVINHIQSLLQIME